jgi:hypothetical protein
MCVVCGQERIKGTRFLLLALMQGQPAAAPFSCIGARGSPHPCHRSHLCHQLGSRQGRHLCRLCCQPACRNMLVRFTWTIIEVLAHSSGCSLSTGYSSGRCRQQTAASCQSCLTRPPCKRASGHSFQSAPVAFSLSPCQQQGSLSAERIYISAANGQAQPLVQARPSWCLRLRPRSQLGRFYARARAHSLQQVTGCGPCFCWVVLLIGGSAMIWRPSAHTLPLVSIVRLFRGRAPWPLSMLAAHHADMLQRAFRIGTGMLPVLPCTP